MSDENEAKEKGIVLPKLFKTVLSGIAVSAAIGSFNLYTEYIAFRQEVASISRGYARLDERITDIERRTMSVESNQEAYHSEGISKLDLILRKLGIGK